MHNIENRVKEITEVNGDLKLIGEEATKLLEELNLSQYIAIADDLYIFTDTKRNIGKGLGLLEIPIRLLLDNNLNIDDKVAMLEETTYCSVISKFVIGLLHKNIGGALCLDFTEDSQILEVLDTDDFTVSKSYRVEVNLSHNYIDDIVKVYSKLTEEIYSS